MKKKLLASILLLLSVSTQCLQASQPATDHLSKFKLLSSRLPDMHAHYAALRNGCINAPWIAKNPAVQKFVQDNFNMIAGVAGSFVGMVGIIGLVAFYCWHHDKNFDKQFKENPQLLADNYFVAVQHALLRWQKTPYKQYFELRFPGRYIPAGMMSLDGTSITTVQKAFLGRRREVSIRPPFKWGPTVSATFKCGVALRMEKEINGLALQFKSFIDRSNLRCTIEDGADNLAVSLEDSARDKLAGLVAFKFAGVQPTHNRLLLQ